MLAIKFSKNGADFGAEGEAIFLTFAHGWDKCFSKMTLENATFPKECKIVTFPTRSEIVHEGSMLESQT